MRKLTGLAVMALALALAVPAFAGDKSEKSSKGYEKCTEDAQTCLNHMVAKLKTRGWLGIEMDDEKGMSAIKITRVVPGSPAEAAGFKTGDVLVSINGARFAENTEEKCVTCDKTKDNWSPGTKVQYVVSRDGKDVTLNPTLAALPSDVLAQWVGMHMIEHAQTEVAKK